MLGDDPAVAFDAIAAELANEVRRLRLLLDEGDHQAAREDAYQRVDAKQLARSLPCVGTVGAPILVATMGRPGRFTSPAAFKASTGLAPRASGTGGDIDLKDQPISKSGSSRLRAQLVISAQTARRVDPQLAAIYHRHIVERGAHHAKALCVVAARLAERALLVMQPASPYIIRDLDGRAVAPAEAKAIIAGRYAISDDIRHAAAQKRRGPLNYRQKRTPLGQPSPPPRWNPDHDAP